MLWGFDLGISRFLHKCTKLPVNMCDTQTVNTGLSFFHQALFCSMGRGQGWQIQSCTGSQGLPMCCSNWCRCGQLWHGRQRQQTLRAFHRHTLKNKSRPCKVKSAVFTEEKRHTQSWRQRNQMEKGRPYSLHESLTSLWQSKIVGSLFLSPMVIGGKKVVNTQLHVQKMYLTWLGQRICHTI